MARRKKKTEEGENLERWMVSYADFVTLLFAFFVVMYAISSVNEGKYRVLSDTLVEAFKQPLKDQQLVQSGDPVVSLVPEAGDYIQQTHLDVPNEGDANPAGKSEDEPVDDRLWVVASNLDSALQGYRDRDLVDVVLQGDRIEIHMKSNMLFDLGSAHLSREALKVLRHVAAIIRRLDTRVQVEGHTDNIPIKTTAFPSNWELSAARAAAVVHYLGRRGVAPERMSAVGYGEFRPVASNDSEEGRQKNRRVTLVLLSGKDDRPAASGPGGATEERILPWAESPGGR